jgi:nicotinamidase-related amidase
MNAGKCALIVIDLQNDYFPQGHFPLWNAEETLANVEQAIGRAQAKGMPVVLVQHIVRGSNGGAPFFNEGDPGAEIDPRIRALLPHAPVVVKEFADSFFQTNLEETLQRLGAEKLVICGMMTQNCVTHTAISKSAEQYDVSILSDCCTTVSEILHKIALRAVSTRISLTTVSAAFSQDPTHE